MHAGKEKTVAIIDFDHPETDKSVTSRFIYGKTQTSPRPLTAAADILKPFQRRNGDRTGGHDVPEAGSPYKTVRVNNFNKLDIMSSGAHSEKSGGYKVK